MYVLYVLFPTEVSHLDVVVKLCSDDPKDFYSLEDRSVLKADQIRENIYFTLPVLCAGFVFAAVYGFIAVTCNLWLLFGTRIGPN